jgi:acetyltransferase-like isoleucine patch superfamily enzyme
MSFVHQTALLADNVKLGAYVKIWSNAVIGLGVNIGDNVVIGSNVYVGWGTTIGQGSRIQHGVFLPNHTVIEENVFIGPNVTLTDDRYPVVNNPGYEALPPTLKSNCSIGAGAVILPGVVIGEGAMVGAGAVVVHDVQSGMTVVGCPAIPMMEERIAAP